MRYFPVFLDLRGQRCLVIGRGRLAGEKAAALRRAGAAVVRAPTHREGLLAGFRLAVDASGEAEVNERTWEEAERLGVLLNVVDVPSRCRFIAPAVVDRDPLLIAISTSGESPFLASALRARLERDFGSEWGPFVRLVGRVRRGLRRRDVPAAAQARTYRRLLRSEILALVRRGRTAEERAAARRLARAPASAEMGTVALVGAGPGDAGLLTRRARELLAEADVVFHDALVEEEVLALCGPGTRLVAAGTRAGRGGRSQ
ncbi:MAG: NAD(P)-dependent oxidoreductase, partial [Candidatus Dormibacterales bacterium]